MPRYEIEAVQKAVAVLRELAAGEGDLGSAELGRRLGLGRSSVFRLLHTLEIEALVTQDPSTRRYRLGPDLTLLGRAAAESFDLRRHARPIMEELSAATNLPVFLNLAGSDSVICMEHVASLSAIELYGRSGHSLPFHACPSGYLFLGHVPDERLAEVLAGPLPRFASETPDAETLHIRIVEARERGWSFARNDLDEDVSSLAVPLLDADGRIAATLAVAGFSITVDSRVPQLVDQLHTASAAISVPGTHHPHRQPQPHPHRHPQAASGRAPQGVTTS